MSSPKLHSAPLIILILHGSATYNKKQHPYEIYEMDISVSFFLLHLWIFTVSGGAACLTPHHIRFTALVLLSSSTLGQLPLLMNINLTILFDAVHIQFSNII